MYADPGQGMFTTQATPHIGIGIGVIDAFELPEKRAPFCRFKDAAKRAWQLMSKTRGFGIS
jgi:hypothetical protein